VLEQQAHALGVVFADSRGREQRRHGMFHFRPCAVLEQEAQQAPIGGARRHAERREPLAIDGEQAGPRVEEHGRDRGVSRARGVVQRRVALGVRQARIRTVGQQGEHGLGASAVAVAGGRQQRRQSIVLSVHIGTAGNQGAQQLHVRQQRGENQDAALVALVRRRQGVGVGAPPESGAGQLHLARARGAQQRRVKFAAVQVLWQEGQRRGHRMLGRDGGGGSVQVQGTQGAMEHHTVRQRKQQRVAGQAE